MSSHLPPMPEWPDRIRRLLKELKLTQAGLAERLGVSPATVSRWVQGKIEPTAEGYVALGNLARHSHGLYFLERAGVDLTNFPEAGMRKSHSSLPIDVGGLTLVGSTRVPGEVVAGAQAVAIPLLKIAAYGDPVPPPENVSLSEAEVEEILLAPMSWCPHPENMIAMHLNGDSMSPLLAPGSLIFVDTATTDRDRLKGGLVVVAHRDLGFKVARLQRYSGTDLLISANQRYAPLDVSNASRWKVFGAVLWWVSRDLRAVS